jgi:hypothetical protein
MKQYILAIYIICCGAASTPAQDHIPNRLIDYDGFLRNAEAVDKLRENRRVTEDQFLEMASAPATVILDARSSAKSQLLHIKGAKNLSLPDITQAELAKVIPSQSTRVLIYCNNNFLNQQPAFPPKFATASLNIYTFNTLYSYGYTNIYELGPLLDIAKTKLPFEGDSAAGLSH